MINGVQVRIPGVDLKVLLQMKSNYHKLKAEAYQKQLDALEATEGQGVRMSSVDPRSEARSSIRRHNDQMLYFTLLARYLDVEETYILSEREVSSLELHKV